MDILTSSVEWEKNQKAKRIREEKMEFSLFI